MRTEWTSFRYRLSRIIEALQWKIPLWALFVCAGAAFFISPVWLLLILLVIAYRMALQQNNKEEIQG